MELIVEGLCKNYGKNKALDQVSFSLSEGVYGLLGPNGAGKTTLLQILSHNLREDSGLMTLDGMNITTHRKEYLKQLGYMPQTSALYPDFTGIQFLNYMAALKGLKKDIAKEQIRYYLKYLQLWDVRNTRIKAYSGGMKQRLLLIQALLGDPKILLLDEPTAGMDPMQRIFVRNMIGNLGAEKIILISTHIVSDVEFISKEIILLSKGKILKKARSEILEEEINGKVFELSLQSNKLEDIQSYGTVSGYTKEKGHTKIRLITDKKMYYGTTAVPNLEDVYLYYFGDSNVF